MYGTRQSLVTVPSMGFAAQQQPATTLAMPVYSQVPSMAYSSVPTVSSGVGGSMLGSGAFQFTASGPKEANYSLQSTSAASTYGQESLSNFDPYTTNASGRLPEVPPPPGYNHDAAPPAPGSPRGQHQQEMQVQMQILEQLRELKQEMGHMNTKIDSNFRHCMDSVDRVQQAASYNAGRVDAGAQRVASFPHQEPQYGHQGHGGMDMAHSNSQHAHQREMGYQREPPAPAPPEPWHAQAMNSVTGLFSSQQPQGGARAMHSQMPPGAKGKGKGAFPHGYDSDSDEGLPTRYAGSSQRTRDIDMRSDRGSRSGKGHKSKGHSPNGSYRAAVPTASRRTKNDGICGCLHA